MRTRSAPASEILDRGERLRRIPVIIVAAALLVAGLLADRASTPTEAQLAISDPPLAQPTAAAAGAEASSWLCPGFATRAGDLSLIIANATPDAVAGQYTQYSPDGASDPVPFEVPKWGRHVVSMGDLEAGPALALLVELGSGAQAVEQAVLSSTGLAITPCAPTASDVWHFAFGRTTKDARATFSVFNPFPDDAVVDFTFQTENGTREPEALRGVIVPGRTVQTFRYDDVVTRRSLVAATVSARRGRVVVSRMTEFAAVDGGLAGLEVSLGSASSAVEWTVPGSPAPITAEAIVHVYNPSEIDAEVDIEFLVDPDDEGCGDEPEPIAITVASQSVESVAVQAVEGGLGEQCAHGLRVRSIDDVEIVVERVVSAGSGVPTGTAVTTGSRTNAQRWILSSGSAGGSSSEVIAVANPSANAALVSVFVMRDGTKQIVAGLEDLEVRGLSQRTIDLGSFIVGEELPVLIESTQPVAVTRSLGSSTRSGWSIMVPIILASPVVAGT